MTRSGSIESRGRGNSLRATAILLAVALPMVMVQRVVAEDLWGGSAAVTSDYLVRGITHSDHQAAAQFDLHVTDSLGWLAGFFASTSRVDPDARTEAELDPFLGFGWSMGEEWRGRVLTSFYAYPWNSRGSKYDYDEFDVDLAYQEWLDFTVVYSPNSPRLSPAYGIVRVAAVAAEANVQRPVLGRLLGTAGVGYSHLEGPQPVSYAYWSIGAAYDLAPVSLTMVYAGTSPGANLLFSNAGPGHRIVGTVIWRF